MLIVGTPLAQAPMLIRLEIDETDNLQTVVDRLSRRQQYQFAYPPQLAVLTPNQRGVLEATSLEDLFAALFDDLDCKSLAPNKLLLRKRLATPKNDAEERWRLEGQVTDAETDLPIPDVLVYLDSVFVHTTTDEQGLFHLDVPSRYIDQLLHFKALSYNPLAIRASIADRNFAVSLRSAPVMVNNVVVVTEKIPSLRLSNELLAVDVRTKRLLQRPANTYTGADVLRTIQMLPGVTAHDDLSSQIRIRGSEGQETLLLLDGIPIYQADHYYGIFSSVNAGFVQEASLYKNGLPVEYGGKTGGMLAMRGPTSLSDLGLDVDMNLLTATAHAQVPTGGNSALFVSSRTSYNNAADNNVFDFTNALDFSQSDQRNISREPLITLEPRYRFYDVNAKWLLIPDKQSSLDLNFFTSRDNSTNEYNLAFQTRLQGRSTPSQELFDHREHWRNLGASVNYERALSGTWKIRSNAYLSRYQQEGDIQSSLRRQAPDNIITDGFVNNQRNEVTDLGAHFFLEGSWRRQEVKFGVAAKRQQVDLSFQEDDVSILGQDQQGSEASLFGDYRWEWAEDLTFSAGGRVSHFSGDDQVYFAPRVQLNYRPDQPLSFKAAWSRSYQYVREITYDNRIGQSINYLILADGGQYPVGSTTAYMLGATFKKGAWAVDAELYRKELDEVMDYALISPGFQGSVQPSKKRNYRVFAGEGKVLGMDLLVSYESKRYSGWLAYTLSESTRWFREILRNRPFPAEDDRRHQLKWVNAYRWGKFTVGGNLVYSSGRPYTDLTLLNTGDDRRQLRPEQRISRLPSYQRVDLSVFYDFTTLGTHGSVGLTCFNLTNHTNVKYIQYIYSIPTGGHNGAPLKNSVVGSEATLLPRVYNVTLRLDL